MEGLKEEEEHMGRQRVIYSTPCICVRIQYKHSQFSLGYSPYFLIIVDQFRGIKIQIQQISVGKKDWKDLHVLWKL